MRKEIHVWHLELPIDAPLTNVDEARPYDLVNVANPAPDFARYLYVAVGAPWLWYMRHKWEYQHWMERMSIPEVSLWVAYSSGSPIGYFELESQPEGRVEICYFGLTPESIGKGFGRHLLEDAIAAARALGERVWLHTCTLDHEYALANYRARGFKVFKEEDIIDDVPPTLDAWPGAKRPAL